MSEAPGIVGGSGPFLGAGAGSALGAAGGLAGLGYLLATGPSPLPAQFQTVQGYSPQEYATGRGLTATGEALGSTGIRQLQSAEAGVLTPEQQAALKQTRNLETNQAMQMFASMGRSPTKDTSFLSEEQTIDANLLAAANQFVATNIAAAFGTISAAGSFIGEGLHFETAASQNMIAAGQAQMQLDKDYSDSISSAFSSLGKMAGAAAAMAPMLMMSDERVKRDIFPIGELENGIGVYTFRFRGNDDTLYMGVIAQDVAEVMPEAVVQGPEGYLLVDYAKLGGRPILFY